MPSYFLAQINIVDPEGYEKYLEKFDAVFKRYNGRVIAVDDAITVLEGTWPFIRTVLIEFPSESALRDWYDSVEYQAIAKHRRDASIANIVVVHGRE